jgi:hypothetical protein
MRQFEKKFMYSKPFVAQVICNKVHLVSAFLDSECLVYEAIIERKTKKLGFTLLRVIERAIREIERVNTSVTQIAHLVNLQLDNHQEQNVYFYVVKDTLGHDFILEKSFQER